MTRAGAPNDLSRAVDDLYAENDTLRRLLADAHDELPWCECRTNMPTVCEYAAALDLKPTDGCS
jgi:hypothetical protein